MKTSENGARKGRPARLAPLSISAVAAAGMLAGCMGAPTYGTGTPADEQLLSDLSRSLTMSSEKEAPIAYSPRPEIVMPPSSTVLPSPQQGVATANNPAWPESPEQRLARIRAEATANQDDPTYRANVIRDDVDTGPKEARPIQTRGGRPMTGDDNGNPRNTREAFNKRLAESRQGSPTQRRYLSEPPLDYRVPAETAASGDVGVDEWKKERDARRAAKDDQRKFWRGLSIPGVGGNGS